MTAARPRPFYSPVGLPGSQLLPMCAIAIIYAFQRRLRTGLRHIQQHLLSFCLYLLTVFSFPLLCLFSFLLFSLSLLPPSRSSSLVSPPMLLPSFSLFPRFHHAKITTTPIKCQWDSTAPWTEFMDLSCVMHCTPPRWAAYPLRGLIIFISRNYPHLFRAAPQIDLHVRMEILNSFFPSVKGR